jgi:hypothetical protein
MSFGSAGFHNRNLATMRRSTIKNDFGTIILMGQAAPKNVFIRRFTFFYKNIDQTFGLQSLRTLASIALLAVQPAMGSVRFAEIYKDAARL